MATSRTFSYLVFITATLLALVIHSYYVRYYVSEHEYTFLSLKPLPPFPTDRKAWIEARKKEAVDKNLEYSIVERRITANASKLQADYKRIYSTPLFLALRPSNNFAGEPIGKAKEKAFWLGCIIPLLIVLLPAFLLLRNFLERSTSRPIHDKVKTMFCRSCGKQISSRDSFCSNCGVQNSSGLVHEPESVELQNPQLSSSLPIDTPVMNNGKGKMWHLVVARVLFGLGFLVVLSIGGLVFPSATLYLVVGYVLVCELIIANAIKSRISPPLTSRQRSLALLPWFIPIIGVIFAFALPYV